MLLQLMRLSNDSALLIAQGSLLFPQPFERLGALIQNIIQALAILVGDNALEIAVQFLEMRRLAFIQRPFERFLLALPAPALATNKQQRPLRRPGSDARIPIRVK